MWNNSQSARFGGKECCPISTLEPVEDAPNYFAIIASKETSRTGTTDLQWGRSSLLHIMPTSIWWQILGLHIYMRFQDVWKSNDIKKIVSDIVSLTSRVFTLFLHSLSMSLMIYIANQPHCFKQTTSSSGSHTKIVPKAFFASENDDILKMMTFKKSGHRL